MSITINDQVSVREIALAISKDWQNVSPYAKDYLEAMKHIDDINGNFYADSAVSVVSYFLANASTYRGENAKAYKDLLKKILKRAR